MGICGHSASVHALTPCRQLPIVRAAMRNVLTFPGTGYRQFWRLLALWRRVIRHGPPLVWPGQETTPQRRLMWHRARTLFWHGLPAMPLKASIASIACVSFCTLLAAAADPSQEHGHYLILESTRVLHGDITRQSDGYHVMRAIGETVVPAEGVIFLCNTLPEAHEHLRQRANLRDADERMRLARWCQLNGLRQEALAEVEAAVTLQPGNAGFVRLRDSLRRSCARVTEHGPAAPLDPDAEAAKTINVEVTAESLGQFITHVQPVLMNTCASCHVSGRGGNFKLLRSNEGGIVNRRATQYNLNAVLNQIRPDHWQASPLLTKSISIHGNASAPPIKGRQSAAYKALEEWVKQTLEDNAQLQTSGPVANEAHDKAGAAAAAAEAKSRTNQPNGAVQSPAADAHGGSPDGKSTASSSSDFGMDQTAKGKSPAPSAAPVDPFDPATFNQANKPPR
jgi:hypothetical protein